MKMPISVDPFYRVAVHEAGHAVASILAHRDLGRDYASFNRILIWRDSPRYIVRKNREIRCLGLCKGPDVYRPGIGLAHFNHEPELRPGFKAEILATIEWSMIISFACPFAVAVSHSYCSQRE